MKRMIYLNFCAFYFIFLSMLTIRCNSSLENKNENKDLQDQYIKTASEYDVSDVLNESDSVKVANNDNLNNKNCSDMSGALIFSFPYNAEKIEGFTYISAAHKPISKENAANMINDAMPLFGGIWEDYTPTKWNSDATPSGDDIYLFQVPATDFGGTIIFDKRNGTMLFAGGTVYMGEGNLKFPKKLLSPSLLKCGKLPLVEPLHSFDILPDSDIFNPDIYNWDNWSDLNGNKQKAVTKVLSCDIVHLMAGCNAINVTVYLHLYKTGCYVDCKKSGAHWIIIITGTAPEALASCPDTGCPPAFDCEDNICVMKQ